MNQVVQELGSRLLGQDFSTARLAQILKHDGGIDTSNLSLEELESLIEDRFTGNWHKPAFSCSELLTRYGACVGDIESSQVVGWACASILLAEVARRGATGWDSQFNFFIDSFLTMRPLLEDDEAYEIFEAVYRK